MTSKTKMMIAAAAMSGLLAGSAARSFAATGATPSAPADSVISKKAVKDAGKLADEKPADKEKGKHDCKGKNACKGQGGCKSSDNGCKGKNSCKGKGGCATNKEEKKEAKLTAAAGVLAKALAEGEKGKHDCKGKNACKGQGGCKSSDNGCKGKNSCKGKGGCATNKEHKEGEKKEGSTVLL